MQPRQQMQQDVSKAGFQWASRYAIGGPPECQGTTVQNAKRHRIDRLGIDFLNGNVHEKSRFAFTAVFYTSHHRLSLRYVVRWPPQSAAVADADDKLITI